MTRVKKINTYPTIDRVYFHILSLTYETNEEIPLVVTLYAAGINLLILSVTIDDR